MNRKSVSICLLTVIILMQFILLIPKSFSSTQSKLYVLFDESHKQYFSYSNGNFKYAINYLNESGDFEVRLNKNGTLLNYTILQNYDILVIPNPGNDSYFTAFELESIKNWTLQGGCLLIMSDYFHQTDINKKGKPSTLNDILINLSIPVEFLESDLADDEQSENYNGQPSYVKISYAQFSNSIIGYKINNAIVRSSCLNITSSSLIYNGAYGPPNSYYYVSSSEKINRPPYWLLHFKIRDSVIILCGATEIFSDLSNPILGSKWYEAGDNLRLWINIFRALAIKQNVMVWEYYLVLIIVVFVVATSLYVYSKSLTPKGAKEKSLSINELVLERSEILKRARQAYADDDFRNAARYYRRALKISEKLRDKEGIGLYSEKLRECLKRSLS